MAHLEVLFPDRDSMIVPLSAEPMSIGRSDECDIQIPSKFVSTRHTSIQLTALIRDLGSTNGTWVGDEQVKERALAAGESFHFGWRDQVKLRIVIDSESRAGADGTAELPLEPPAELAEQEGVIREQKVEIDRLCARIEELEASQALAMPDLTDVHSSGVLSQPVVEPEAEDLESEMTVPEPLAVAKPAVDAAPAADSNDSDLREELRDLQDRLGFLEGELASEVRRTKEVTHERDVLMARVEELEASEPREPALASVAAPPIESSAAPVATPSSTEVSADSAEVAGGLVREFASSCGLALDDTLLETMRRRVGFAQDFGYVCGRLLSFSRDVEQVISHMSLEFRGTSRLNEGNVTVLPGSTSRDNLRHATQALFMQGGPELKSAFDGHLDHLGKWYLACVSAYKAAIQEWYPDFRRRLGRAGIEKRTEVSGMLRAFGLQYREYWEAYGKLLEDLTDEIIIDEIDQAAAKEAVKIAEGGAS